MVYKWSLDYMCLLFPLLEYRLNKFIVDNLILSWCQLCDIPISQCFSHAITHPHENSNPHGTLKFQYVYNVY